ncbi:L,D-transpeptidase (plasmid) [Priestia megaterium]
MKLKKLALAGVVATSLFGLSVGGTQASAAQTTQQKGDMIIINKKYNKLVFLHDGKIKMIESVGTGKDWNHTTPVGHWKVVQKVKNRPYYKKNIPGGDPRNPLGPRWLGINANGTSGNVYAIHGNSNPNSIGGYVSAGCIRMYNKSVVKLYDQVKIGTPVKITVSNKSFTELAALYHYKVTGYDTK